MYFSSFYPLDSPCEAGRAGILLPLLRWGPWSSRGFHVVSAWAGTLPTVWYMFYYPDLPAPTSSFSHILGIGYAAEGLWSLSEFPQRLETHLSWCCPAISRLLWESVLASLTMLNQALNIFFWRRCTCSFCTSSSRSVRYWGWGQEQKWDKQCRRQRIRANKQYKRELQQIQKNKGHWGHKEKKITWQPR